MERKGRPKAGLHKRSAEDWGHSLSRARDGVPHEGLVTLLCAERMNICIWGGRCGKERTAEEGVGRRQLIAGWRQGGNILPSIWRLITLALTQRLSKRIVSLAKTVALGSTHVF